MYKPVDRYSYVEDYDEFVASMAGDFVGHGILIKIDEESKAKAFIEAYVDEEK